MCCSSSVKNAISNLIGIKLNMQIAFSSVVILTILIFLIQEHVSPFASQCLISLISILQFSDYRSFASQTGFFFFLGCCHCHCSVAKSYPTFLPLNGLQPSRVLCPWDFPGKSISVGCLFLFQGILLTQGLNSSLALQEDSLQLNHREALF